MLLELLMLSFLVTDDARLPPHREQLRNGFHSSKCFMRGGLRGLDWVVRGSVAPQGKRNIPAKIKDSEQNTVKYHPVFLICFT